MTLTKRQYIFTASSVAIIAFAGLAFSGHMPSSLLRTSYSIDNPDASGPDSRAFTASVASPTPSPSASTDQTAPAPAGGVLGSKTTPSTPSALGAQAGNVIAPNPTTTPTPTPPPTSYTREEFKNTNPPQGVYYLCGDTYQTTKCDPGLQLVPSNPDPNDTTVQK